MTIKEIYEQTVFGTNTPAYLQDYGTCYCGNADMYLMMYKKASRKNAAKKYRDIKQLLDREAAVIKHTNLISGPHYEIRTVRSFEGTFGKPLNENEEIYIK